MAISKDVPLKGQLNIRCNCSGKSRIFLRGAPTPEVGVLTYYFAFFAQTARKRKNLDGGGGGGGPVQPVQKVHKWQQLINYFDYSDVFLWSL